MKNRLKKWIVWLLFLIKKVMPKNVLYWIIDKVLYQKEIKKRNLKKDCSPMFDYVLFELRSKCNGTCSFCSANRHFDTREDIVMPLETYKKVINELKQINFSGAIAFYLNNEPLIVPNFFDYVKIAVEELKYVNIFQFSTNGLVLTENTGEKLLQSGINRIYINLYDDNIDSPLPPRILRFKDMATIHNNENNKKVTLEISRTQKDKVLLNRAGSAPNRIKNDKTVYRGFCLYPFEQFCIGPTGDVSMCCNDVFFSKVVGNVCKENILDIWNGKELNFIRNELLQGNRYNLTNCKKCDRLGVEFDKNGSFLHRILIVMTKGRALNQVKKLRSSRTV